MKRGNIWLKCSLVDRTRAEPMFQLALPAVLFKFKHRGPVLVPLLQLPNRRATARRRSHAPLLIFSMIKSEVLLLGELCLAAHPQTPQRGGYTATPTGGNRRRAEPRFQAA